MKPSLRQLQYLVALSEKLNFRQCAQDLNVTQPTLSGQIRELEERLGVALFERTSRNVKVTPIGEKIVEKSRIILHDVDYLCETATLASKSLGGIIHLGVPSSVGPYLLPYVIPRLHKEYPDLKLHITEGPTRELEKKLDQGKYDLLFSTTPSIMEELTSMTLFEEPLVAGLAAENRLSDKKELNGSDLAGQKVITLGAGHQLFEQAQAISTQYGCQIMSEYEGTSLDALRQMVAMNMGISFFPALYSYSEIHKTDQVISRPFKGGEIRRAMGLIWRRASPRIKDYHIIADIIRAEVKERFSEIILI